MTRLFPDKEIVCDPFVLIRVDHPEKNDFSFKVRKLKGEFYRVIPNTAKEVFFLQLLSKNVFRYTPESGDGVIITLNCFDSRGR